MAQSSFAGALQGMVSRREVRLTLDPAQTLAVIPRDFMGLGYEISSVARPGLLSAQDSVYVQLVGTLGTQGVIRVGGNTADYASYSATGQPLSSPEGKAGSVVNEAVLSDLGTFLDATGWKLIWGLNLGNGTPENAIEEAKAVTAAAKKLRAVSESSGFPYRICETNSFSGGGKPGVSDTLAAALWVLDFMFILASAGCAGVNMETGVNQRGFISSYSPIGDDEQGHYHAAPEYYGMLAFAQSGAGRMIGSTIESGDRNLTAYATQPTKDRIVLTLINKEPASDAVIVIEAGASAPFRSGSLVRLRGPSLETKSGVTLGGAGVSPAGLSKPTRIEDVTRTRRRLQVRVPAASAAVVALHG